MLLFGETKEKHPGDLQPTVPDLPLHNLKFPLCQLSSAGIQHKKTREYAISNDNNGERRIHWLHFEDDNEYGNNNEYEAKQRSNSRSSHCSSLMVISRWRYSRLVILH